MKLQLRTYEEWVRQATRVRELGIQPYQFRSQNDGLIEIRPRISEHENVTILSGDWLPVHADGSTTFEEMVHSPSLYPAGSKSVRAEGDGYRAVETQVRETDRPLILCGGFPNIYHWLVIHLPRLLAADGIDDYADWSFAVNDDLAPFQIETLDMLCIGPERLVRLGPHEAVRAPRVAVPTQFSLQTVCHPVVPLMLHEVFAPRPAARGRRIFLSRADASSRRLVNEEALVALLDRHGFEKIVIGSMSFQAQIDLFASAGAIVSAHGAGLANLLFAQPGTQVFEISSALLRVTSMKHLAAIREQPHCFIDAEVVSDNSVNPLLNDWEVDLDQMQAALSHL